MESRLQEGIGYYRSNHIQKAMHLFTQLINENRKDFQLYYYYGNCLDKTQMFKQAIETFEEANRISNEYEGNIQMKIGECHRKLKEYDRAIKCFDFVKSKYLTLELNALYCTSQALFESGKYTEAINELQTYKRKLPADQLYKAEIELALIYFKFNDYKSAYCGLHSVYSNIKPAEYQARIQYYLARASKNMLFYHQATENFKAYLEKLTQIDPVEILLYNYYLTCDLNEVINQGNKLIDDKILTSSQKDQMVYVYLGNAIYFKDRNNKTQAASMHSQYKGDIKDLDYLSEMMKYFLATEDDINALKYLKSLEGYDYIPGLILIVFYSFKHNDLQQANQLMERLYSLSYDGNQSIEQYNKYMDKLGLSFLCLSAKDKTIDIEIGQGGFGKVLLRRHNGEMVVVKSILDNLNEEVQKEIKESLCNEIQLLTNVQHANIVKYKGFIDNRELYLEYCGGKDLSTYLKKGMSFKFKCHAIRQIAEGLRALHKGNIVHGDMKSKNILLDKVYCPSKGDKPEDYPTLKICDFGLAKCRDLKLKEIEGKTYAYAAPELFTKSTKTKESDVYAFGIIINELITGEIPFSNKTNKDIEARIKDGQRPDEDIIETEWKETKGKDIRCLMKKCWAQNPQDRPTMEEVCKQLDLINSQ